MSGAPSLNISERRQFSIDRFEELQKGLSDAATLATGKACVYATGSYGRQEASAHSDLDLFIIGETSSTEAGQRERLLNRLDEICLKSDLIRSVRNLGIKDFDGDGRYLIHYSTDDLLGNLGTPEDDHLNTFTARLLLLLESKPLLGEDIYRNSIGSVLGEYWEDYASHRNDFIPAYLANDILRLWRTFCVNYEARTHRQPERLNAKRKIKNYKLKHSRLLTCYSSLLYMLAIYTEHETVGPNDAKKMTELTPLERLKSVEEMSVSTAARPALRRAIDSYRTFLDKTNQSEDALLDIFLDDVKSKAFRGGSEELGQAIFEAMNGLGRNGRFHRLLVV